METILYFQSTATTSAQMKLRGVCQAAHRRNWIVQRFDLRSTKKVYEKTAFWHPLGCIIESGSDDFACPTAQRGTNAPFVLLDCNPSLAAHGARCVTQDPNSTGELAAREFLSLGITHCAYVCWPRKTFWSEMRGKSFQEAVRAGGGTIADFKFKASERGISGLRAQLRNWIADLPSPTGIYAVNDSMAAQILSAAQDVGKSVPEDIAILGTDNEVDLCENIRPTLASIELDFESAGRAAVTLLENALAQKEKRRQIRFGPLGVVRRVSIRRFPQRNKSVTEALDFIREHASEGISANDVLPILGGSRRAAETCFLGTTGHTLLEEIHMRRIELAKDIIKGSDTKLSAVYARCGASSPAFFSRLFKRETGMTMSEWRAHHLA